jgi:hypothetical protein
MSVVLSIRVIEPKIRMQSRSSLATNAMDPILARGAGFYKVLTSSPFSAGCVTNAVIQGDGTQGAQSTLCVGTTIPDEFRALISEIGKSHPSFFDQYSD